MRTVGQLYRYDNPLLKKPLDLPHAFRYAVSEEWYTRHGVRRYGFHGISHRFVSEQAAAMLGRPPAVSGWSPRTSATGAARPRCATACRWIRPWGSPRWTGW